MEILLIFLTPCFPRTDDIFSSLAYANSLVLISLLGALNFVLWMVFIFNMLFACLQLSTSTSKLPFLVFLTVFGEVLEEIFFYKERREFDKADLIQTFNKNASGEVCCLILQVWFWMVSLSFLIWRHHICSIFYAIPALHYSPQSSTCVDNEAKEKPIRLGWDWYIRSVYSRWW